MATEKTTRVKTSRSVAGQMLAWPLCIVGLGPKEWELHGVLDEQLGRLVQDTLVTKTHWRDDGRFPLIVLAGIAAREGDVFGSVSSDKLIHHLRALSQGTASHRSDEAFCFVRASLIQVPLDELKRLDDDTTRAEQAARLIGILRRYGGHDQDLAGQWRQWWAGHGIIISDIISAESVSAPAVQERLSDQSTSSPANASALLAAALRQLAVDLPKDFKGRAVRLAVYNHEFRQGLAELLEPALNAYIRAMPQQTLDDKKAICDVVASTLEPIGLAVKCPNTDGLPGTLKASSGHWPGVGRFHFEAYIEGKRKMPAYSDALPELELIDATSVAESKGTWQDRVTPKSNRSTRRRP